MRSAFLIVVALLGTPLPVQGDSGDLWHVPSEAEATFDNEMEAGRRLLLAAANKNLPALDAQALARRALSHFATASGAAPHAHSPHLASVYVIEKHFAEDEIVPNVVLEELIAHIDAVESNAPMYFGLEDLYFKRALAHTKIHGQKHLELALADYDKSLAILDHSSNNTRGQLSIHLSNRAEVLMMLGRLDEAIEGYEAAIRKQDSITHGYGLAVALDRDGQDTRAREIARRYARMDHANALHESGTFFVPAAEVFYYEGLRQESIGNYPLAAEHYRQFIEELPHSAYAAKARKNLKTIAGKRKALDPKAPHPQELDHKMRGLIFQP